MATATRPRRPRGRPSLYSDADSLLPVVRDVALAADPRFPAEVSMRVWNQQRAAGGHADSPTAEAIHQRINRGNPRRLTWAKIIESSLLAQPEARITLAAGRGADNRHQGARHVHFALRLVASELDVATFPSSAYEPAVERLLAAEARLPADQRRPLESLLPAISRIVEVAGSWNAAMDLAGLPRWTQTTRRVQRAATGRSLGMVEGIVLFVKANGRYPGHPTLRRFAHMMGARLEARGGSYTPFLDAAEEELRRQRIPVPAERPRSGRPPSGLEIRLPEEIPDGLRGPEDSWWTPAAILEVLREYDQALPSGAPRTRARYVSQISAHPDWPAARTIKRHGGWALLMGEAKRLNVAQRRGQPVEPGEAILNGEDAEAGVNSPRARRRTERDQRRNAHTGPRRTPDGRVVELADLLAGGVLTSETPLRLAYNGSTYTGHVTADGRLAVDGHGTYDNLNLASKALLGVSKNGWIRWKVDEAAAPGERACTLDDLRIRLLGGHADDSSGG